MKTSFRSFALGALCGLVAAVTLSLAIPAVADISSAQKGWLKQSIPGNSGPIDDIVEVVGFGPATLTTAFTGIAANDCKLSAAITVTGAADGDICKLGAPAASEALDVQFSCHVSASNAVKIKLCNETAADIESGIVSGTYTVRVEDR